MLVQIKVPWEKNYGGDTMSFEITCSRCTAIVRDVIPITAAKSTMALPCPECKHRYVIGFFGRDHHITNFVKEIKIHQRKSSS